ncbi:cell division protein SepF [Methanothermococcus sp. SCGC AD-155-C09]|nr:cell division protein SepF [Methanothermococcus sp. SCGC AD-155-C09]
MVLESLKKIFKKDDNKKIKFISSNLTSIGDIGEYEELPVDTGDIEEENIIKIKVIDLEDYRDAADIVVMAESGHIVIANTVNLEKDVDEEYSKLILYLKDKTAEFGGTLIRICENRIFVLPKNVVIEKLVKEMDNDDSM